MPCFDSGERMRSRSVFLTLLTDGGPQIPQDGIVALPRVDAERIKPLLDFLRDPNQFGGQDHDFCAPFHQPPLTLVHYKSLPLRILKVIDTPCARGSSLMAEKPTMAVRIPKRLWEELTAFIRKHGGYLNEAEYIREAVRWKLDEERTRRSRVTRARRANRRSSFSSRKEEPIR